MIIDARSKDFPGIFNLWKGSSLYTSPRWAMWPVNLSKWLFLSLLNEFNCALQRHSASDRGAELVSLWSILESDVQTSENWARAPAFLQADESTKPGSLLLQGEALTGWAYFFFFRCVRDFFSFSFHSEQKWQWLLGCCWTKQVCARLGTPDWVPESKCHLWITD